MEAHETIQNCKIVYSINREKLHQLILRQEFVQNTASNQMLFPDENIFQITLAALQ